MVSAADKDKSGYLDKEEFLALVARKWEHLEEVSNFKKIYQILPSVDADIFYQP